MKQKTCSRLLVQRKIGWMDRQRCDNKLAYETGSIKTSFNQSTSISIIGRWPILSICRAEWLVGHQPPIISFRLAGDHRSNNIYISHLSSRLDLLETTCNDNKYISHLSSTLTCWRPNAVTTHILATCFIILTCWRPNAATCTSVTCHLFRLVGDQIQQQHFWLDRD